MHLPLGVWRQDEILGEKYQAFKSAPAVSTMAGRALTTINGPTEDLKERRIKGRYGTTEYGF